MICVIPYQSAVRMIVPRFPGSLMPSRMSVSSDDFCDSCPGRNPVLCDLIFTTKSPSLFDESVVMRSSSHRVISVVRNGKYFSQRKSVVKNPSIISKSEERNSSIPFRPSTRKHHDSRLPCLSWRLLMYCIFDFVSMRR